MGGYLMFSDYVAPRIVLRCFYSETLGILAYVILALVVILVAYGMNGSVCMSIKDTKEWFELCKEQGY